MAFVRAGLGFSLRNIVSDVIHYTTVDPITQAVASFLPTHGSTPLDPFNVLPDSTDTQSKGTIDATRQTGFLDSPPVDSTPPVDGPFDPLNIGILSMPDKLVQFIYSQIMAPGVPVLKWNNHPFLFGRDTDRSYAIDSFASGLSLDDWRVYDPDEFFKLTGLARSDFLNKFSLPQNGNYLAVFSKISKDPGGAAQGTLFIRQPDGIMVPLMSLYLQHDASDSMTGWESFRDMFLKPAFGLFSSLYSGNWFTFAVKLIGIFNASKQTLPTLVQAGISVVPPEPLVNVQHPITDPTFNQPGSDTIQTAPPEKKPNLALLMLGATILFGS